MSSPRLALVLAIAAAGCGQTYTRTYPEPTPDQVVAKLAEARGRATSFRAETLMDSWLGDQRVKTTVKMMGETGAKVRVNFLSPAGGNVLADLACDGTSFVLVDFQKNCALTGPCNADSIAQYLRVPLDPDDFLYMATGTTPVLEGATGKVTWDAKNGHEIVELTGPSGSQRIVLDGRGGTWDVLESRVRNTAGAEVWKLENKGFEAVEDEAGVAYRVPTKSHFVSGSNSKADLIIEWQDRTLNPQLNAQKFTLTPPAGLPRCR